MTHEEILTALTKHDRWGVDSAPDLDLMIEECEWWDRRNPIQKLELAAEGSELTIVFEHVPDVATALSLGNICDYYDYENDEKDFTLWWN